MRMPKGDEEFHNLREGLISETGLGTLYLHIFIFIEKYYHKTFFWSQFSLPIFPT